MIQLRQDVKYGSEWFVPDAITVQFVLQYGPAGPISQLIWDLCLVGF
jgi:hypothetical protein